MHVKVTEEHIAKGKRRAMSFCPIALAIKEQASNSHVDVMPRHVYIGLGDDTRICDLPQIAHDFVVAFDMGNDVHPFEFETECRRLYAREEGR